MSNKLDLYEEVTGRKPILKEISISELKIDQSKLDQQLLDKICSFEKSKNSLKKEVGMFCGLTLNYLDSLCTLDLSQLDSDEKEHVIGIIDLVIKNTQNMLKGLVLPVERLDKLTNDVGTIGKFSQTCFEDTDIPMLLPLCQNTIKLLEYSYVVGAYIGELNKFKEKDIKYIKEYSEFLLWKSRQKTKK